MTPVSGDELLHVGLVGTAVLEAAAVDEHVHRAAVAALHPGRTLHVDEQAVLGLRARSVRARRRRAAVAELVGRLHP